LIVFEEIVMSEQYVQMALAVAESIVQRREVSWIFYSDGSLVVPSVLLGREA